MPAHLPRHLFILVALPCNAGMHWALSSLLASPADIGIGVQGHYATAFAFFVSVGLLQHNPYGRYAGTGMLGMGGITACNQLCWVLQEAPAFGAALWALLRHGKSPLSDPGAFLLCLFAAHYFQRSFIFPLLMRGRKPTAVYIYLAAGLYCAFNGHLMSLALLNTSDYRWDPQFVVGVSMFLFGMLANIHCDQHLRSLRQSAQDIGYKIPYSGLFRWVSGANFLSEIIEWGGFAIAARHHAATAFFLAVLGNIGPRAISHHKWYCDKFGDEYIKLGRSALIPYVL